MILVFLVFSPTYRFDLHPLVLHALESLDKPLDPLERLELLNLRPRLQNRLALRFLPPMFVLTQSIELSNYQLANFRGLVLGTNERTTVSKPHFAPKYFLDSS